MLLYDITQAGHFVFLSRINTQKWYDLTKNPSVTLHALNLEKGQIIVQGTATLKTVDNDLEFCQAYWHKMMPETQNIYRQDCSDSMDHTRIPDSFGGIMVVPDFFDVLELRSDDYTKSCRLQFRWEGDEWLPNSAQAV
jgi:hypothetical protein